jgi:putative ABC transport system substrate-binding protein
MRRRAFLATLGGAAAWPLAARAGPRVPRIGYLAPVSAEADKPLLEAFVAGLGDLGYIPGKTIEIEARFADGREDEMARLASALVDLGVDLIVTGGTGVYAAHDVTKIVPIVAAVAGDLVAVGLADSLDHPGGNVTGQTFFFLELMTKRIALLKQLKPAISSVGLVIPRHYSAASTYLRALDAPVGALGVALKPIELAEPNDCDRALSSGNGASVEGLAVTEAPAFNVGVGPGVIAAAAARHRLPAVGALSLARNGGLLGYGVDLVPMSRRAAAFVDKILKGAKPGDIPIERATTFHFIVNLKTAAALGLEISPALLAAADEVIE